METVSPAFAWFASSWACSLVERLTYLPYSGCRSRRSIMTTMDLSILSLTTLPVSVRAFFSSAISVTCLLVEHSFHPGDVPTNLLEQMVLAELARGLLHAQVELLAEEFEELLLELLYRSEE